MRIKTSNTKQQTNKTKKINERTKHTHTPLKTCQNNGRQNTV